MAVLVEAFSIRRRIRHITQEIFHATRSLATDYLRFSIANSVTTSPDCLRDKRTRYKADNPAFDKVKGARISVFSKSIVVIPGSFCISVNLFSKFSAVCLIFISTGFTDAAFMVTRTAYIRS
jgi:hypothetical protein